MASFQVGQSCYSSALAAVQAIASGQSGAVVVVGTSSYVVDVVGTSDTSMTLNFSDVGSPASFVKVVPVTPLPCGLLDTADGLILAWGIATAWLVTAAVLFLRRGIHE